jgi:histidinol-phosphate/aromatic aminotransferase/cobyric acid decarboxylase-like protein
MLRELGMRAPPSESNFLLVTVPETGPSAARIAKDLDAKCDCCPRRSA